LQRYNSGGQFFSGKRLAVMQGAVVRDQSHGWDADSLFVVPVLRPSRLQGSANVPLSDVRL